MRIGLFGQFGTGNSGNDGSLEAMIAMLRRVRPDAELICICPETAVVEQKFGIRSIGIGVAATKRRAFTIFDRMLLNVPGRALNLAWPFAQARKLDVIVVPGTGILDDFSETAFGWPYIILRWCLAARSSRVPVYFVSIGAGPIKRPLSRTFMKVAARMAAYRSYRDWISRDFMKSIGIDTAHDAVNCDIAFDLPPPVARPRPVSAPVCVAVGVMAYNGWRKGDPAAAAIYETYLEKLQAFVTWLLARGMQVRFLTGDVSDARTVRDLLDRLGTGAASNSGVAVQATDSLHELMAEIAKADIVVATRYHNVVCALKMGRPTISLGYAAKNDELLERVGHGAFCHHVETFEVDALKRQVDDVIERRSALSARIRQAMDGFAIELKEQERALGRRLGALAAGTGQDRSLPQTARGRSRSS